jgi:hypothetical protein
LIRALALPITEVNILSSTATSVMHHVRQFSFLAKVFASGRTVQKTCGVGGRVPVMSGKYYLFIKL